MISVGQARLLLVTESHNVCMAKRMLPQLEKKLTGLHTTESQQVNENGDADRLYMI